MADPTIGELLQQSRAAHEDYRRLTPHKSGQAGGQLIDVPGDPVAARAALQLAYDLRKRAHDLDPTGASSAWLSEPNTFNHDDVLTWYEQMLAR